MQAERSLHAEDHTSRSRPIRPAAIDRYHVRRRRVCGLWESPADDERRRCDRRAATAVATLADDVSMARNGRRLLENDSATRCVARRKTKNRGTKLLRRGRHESRCWRRMLWRVGEGRKAELPSAQCHTTSYSAAAHDTGSGTAEHAKARSLCRNVLEDP
ncbi:hypothetical protein PsYK624_054250 [Phanerochaete sordida]|uniref:Uncharacterized protein n=1 Tax=Phanerochaete sordida TaxID=48140 RepID=A0A9P3G6W2_9APHY|nr:hypothetical protein PsYK624_054250 [Phanerochaete sordida]